MKLEPLGGRILVRKVEGSDVSEGGIVLPAGEGLTQYEVLAVGPGAYSAGKLCPPQVKAGDKVVLELKELSASESCRIGGERVWIIGAEFMVAKVSEEPVLQ